MDTLESVLKLILLINLLFLCYIGNVHSKKYRNPNKVHNIKITSGGQDMGCPGNFFQCVDKECIMRTARCDGEEDCYDGSDEENCFGPVPPPEDPLAKSKLPTDFDPKDFDPEKMKDPRFKKPAENPQPKSDKLSEKERKLYQKTSGFKMKKEYKKENNEGIDAMYRKQEREAFEQRLKDRRENEEFRIKQEELKKQAAEHPKEKKDTWENHEDIDNMYLNDGGLAMEQHMKDRREKHEFRRKHEEFKRQATEYPKDRPENDMKRKEREEKRKATRDYFGSNADLLPEQVDCPKGFFLCGKPEYCIMNRYVCDGEAQCKDGSDEINCIHPRRNPDEL